MTQEEKAKAYDEIIGRAKKELDVCGSQDCDAAKQIFRLFPELRESENEKIRKEIIEDYKISKRLFSTKEEEKIIDKKIAWLEKQGEKLPVGFYYVNSEGKKFYSDTFKYGDVILHVEKQDEQKPAWSEEDEKMIDAALQLAHEYGRHGLWYWLKSLKQRMEE